MNHFTQNMIDDINRQADDYFKEGLRRKGFSFESQWEYQNFVAAHCRGESISPGEQIFYVDDEPFLKRNFKTDVQLDYSDIKNMKISADCGTVEFL